MMINQIELRSYKNWIDQNVTHDDAIGNCSLFTKLMKQAFPELEIVVGSIKNKFSKNAYHEWLVTKDGHIVDPTKKQFQAFFGDEWSYNS